MHINALVSCVIGKLFPNLINILIWEKIKFTGMSKVNEVIGEIEIHWF